MAAVAIPAGRTLLEGAPMEDVANGELPPNGHGKVANAPSHEATDTYGPTSRSEGDTAVPSESPSRKTAPLAAAAEDRKEAAITAVAIDSDSHSKPETPTMKEVKSAEAVNSPVVDDTQPEENGRTFVTPSSTRVEEDGEVRVQPGEMAIPPPPTHGFRPQTMSEAHQREAEQAHLDQLNEPLAPEELIAFAEYLGMEPGADSRFLWLAEQALCAPLPEGWQEIEDHRGDTFYLYTDADGDTLTSWQHPYDDFYRELFLSLKAAQWDLATYEDVVDMAVYLELDPQQHRSLMWIPHQAVTAPLPDGWQQLEDENGSYFVNPKAGASSRAHPLDSVFRIAATVERTRLQRGEYSLARAAALGEGSGRPTLEMRLVEEEGSGAYTFDWLAGRRVSEGADGSSGGQPDSLQALRLKQLAARAAGDGSLTINTIRPDAPGSPQSPARLDSLSEEPLANSLRSPGTPGTPPFTPGSPANGTGTASPVSPGSAGQRLSLVTRQSSLGKSPVLERKGSATQRSRFAQRPTRKRNPKLGMRPFEHYPTGLPDTRRPEGWQILNPAAVWLWLLYYTWAWALVLPLIRRVLPKPPER